MLRNIDPLLEAVSVESVENLHLIDIENLAGTGLLTLEQVSAVKREYERCCPLSDKDVVVIATGPQNSRAVWEGWGKAIYRSRKGKDGADLALINLFESIDRPERFAKIFVASGDGGLAPIAQVSRDLGLKVTVISRRESCSHKFRSFDKLAIH